MDSLNVPIPADVEALAEELRPLLTSFDQIRDVLTLVLKRFPGGEPPGRIEHQTREALRGTGPFPITITGIETFDTPPVGPAPVVYLAVEGDGLGHLHHRLVEQFGAVPEIEGDAYHPHITLARGCDRHAPQALLDRDIPSMTWTVDRLLFWDARRSLPAGHVRLSD